MVDLDAFSSDGYAKVEQAAPRQVADSARALLWPQLGVSPDAPREWAEPVLWASDMTGQGPFGELVRSPVLAAALDRTCGAGGWLPRGALGNIPVRFPVSPPNDDRGERRPRSAVCDGPARRHVSRASVHRARRR